MNEKLSLPTATPIEQLQQQQAQQRTNTCATIDQTDYRYESTLPAAGAGAVAATTHNATTTTYQHDSSSNSNNAQTSGIDVGCVENGAGGAGPSVIAGSELYRYASVASLGGTSTMLAVDAYMAGGGAGAVAGAGVQATPLASSAATILKISHTGSVGGSKGSNMNSPHKQPAGAPQRGNFCGCFGSGRDPSGGAGGEDAGCVGDKQQLPTLTFWPALFANLGICTLLLGYLFIGSFLFLTIETSGDGGSAAGVVSDPNAWSYAQNAHISTQQKQQQTQQTPQTSFNRAQSKLYHSSEQLLDMATATGGAHFLGTDMAAAAAADGGQPHENSMTSTSSSKFHVNTPNAMRHATAAAMVANGTQAATPVAADAAHFDVLARAETETYTADNRHANNKLRPPPNSMSLQQQQSNDMAAAKATYATLRQAMAAEAHRAHRATNVIDAVIGNDINAAVGDVDFGLRNGDDGIEVEMADMAAENGDAWNGENVALQRTVENIWDITVSLNILYKENWTKLAALEINKFQDQLVKRLVMDLTLSTAGDGVAPATTTTMLHDAHSRQTQQVQQQQQQQPFDYHSMEPTTSKHYGNDAVQQQNGRQQQQQQRERYWQLQAARHRQWQLQQQQQQFEWNFATSFLYSLTVVTTVGYGTITPRTTLGRMVTIVYATLGIPLTLVYLSSIGSILAKLASSFCERLLCCCFCRATTNKRNSFCGFSRQQVADKKCNLKLQQLQRHHQQQHAASSAQQTAQQPTQSAHLPYCYVRPPADDTLSYGEHSPHSAHSPTTRSTAAHTLRWSLVLPVGFCVLLLLAYVTFGSLVIALLEQWSLFDGVYFCFMSLTTIGFCDLLPGVHARPATSTSTVVVWFCAAYILSGLTLTSMCVNMLHEEFLQRMRVVVKFKKMSTSRNTAKERSFYGAPP